MTRKSIARILSAAALAVALPARAGVLDFLKGLGKPKAEVCNAELEGAEVTSRGPTRLRPD